MRLETSDLNGDVLIEASIRREMLEEENTLSERILRLLESRIWKSSRKKIDLISQLTEDTQPETSRPTFHERYFATLT